jgi:CRISPR/Cas system endoribonuclease Cas6 (RAMP superfamily)
LDFYHLWKFGLEALLVRSLMELLSVVIYLRAIENITNLKHTGHQAQGWLLEQIRRFDRSMANTLHPSSIIRDRYEDKSVDPDINVVKNSHTHTGQTNFRPYTISGIMRGGVQPTQIVKGDRCWIRLTTYDQKLSKLLQDHILPDINEKLKSGPNLPILPLGKHNYFIEDWTDDNAKHEWAGKATCQMLEKWSQLNLGESIDLEFCSLTHFKRNAMDVPLPISWMVFKSYWEQWEISSGREHESKIGEFIDECVALSAALIQTGITTYPFGSKRKPERGFIGQCKFALIHNNKKNKWSKADFNYYGNIIKSLAAFSFFCGTGHHTTIGLGQTRLIK